MSSRFLIYIFVILILQACSNPIFEQKLDKVLGVRFPQAKLVYLEDEFAGFGEGYALEVYQLSESTLKNFETLKTKNLLLHVDEEGWEVSGWYCAPIISDFHEVASVLSYSGGVELVKHFNQMEQLLKSDNAYYAFCTKSHLQTLFFVLDTKTGLLYIADAML